MTLAPLSQGCLLPIACFLLWNESKPRSLLDSSEPAAVGPCPGDAGPPVLLVDGWSLSRPETPPLTAHKTARLLTPHQLKVNGRLDQEEFSRLWSRLVHCQVPACSLLTSVHSNWVSTDLLGARFYPRIEGCERRGTSPHPQGEPPVLLEEMCVHHWTAQGNAQSGGRLRTALGGQRRKGHSGL